VGTLSVVDTFPAFARVWEDMASASLEEQLAAWRDAYLARWPELLDQQVQAYARDGQDWQQVARERVLSFLTERLPAMHAARESVLAELGPVYRRAGTALGYEGDLVAVLYVGAGCGAGWATTYGGRPAILYGLEMLAECGWTGRASVRGMTAHEVAHIAQYAWRERAGLPIGDGPWWTLYEEGFAQYGEHLILGRETWHESSGINTPDWLTWCRSQRRWLAQEYLRRVEADEPVRAFFGSWHDLRGRRQCGYFLGHEALRVLASDLDVTELALLKDYASAMQRAMAAIVND
jgi:hypothetical protein